MSKRLVDSDTLKYLIVKANLSKEEVEMLKQDINKQGKLSRKPNTKGEEGYASQDEWDYRILLRQSVERIDTLFKKLINKKTDPDDAIDQLDSAIDGFIEENTQRVRDKNLKRFTAGWDRVNKKIERNNKKYPELQPIPLNTEDDRLTSLQRQQIHNIEHIALIIRGKLRQLINMFYLQDNQTTTKQEDIIKDTSTWTPCMKEQHKLHPEYSETELQRVCALLASEENAVAEGQDRMDALGMFGYLYSNFSGIIAAGLIGVGTMEGFEMKLPWLTCEDNSNCATESPVCEECIANAISGPYDINNYPTYPAHMKCRCNDPFGDPIIIFMGVELT